MLTRQRVILDLLLHAPQRPSKMLLLKWLFLGRHETQLGRLMAFYDFVPYHYGPFSFCVYRELRDLASEGLLREEGAKITVEKRDRAAAHAGELSTAARVCVEEILDQYGTMSTAALLKHVYAKYPWYAFRSQLAAGTKDDSKNADTRDGIAFYTIGYEGRSIDAFLDALMRGHVRCLVDVRSHAFSRKYGFSKSALQNMCNKVGIEYVHVPELGIPSQHRSNLTGPAAYKKLFDYYEQKILPQQETAVQQLAGLVAEKPSALLCFEADHRMCHRGRLAAVLEDQTGFDLFHL